MWQETENSLTVTGRTFPLELFLEQLNFDPEDNSFIFLPMAERTIAAARTDVYNLAATWGWEVAYHYNVVPAPAPEA